MNTNNVYMINYNNSNILNGILAATTDLEVANDLYYQFEQEGFNNLEIVCYSNVQKGDSVFLMTYFFWT